MRILHFDTAQTFRGGQQQVLFLMQGLRAFGHPQLLIASSDSPLAAQAKDSKFEVDQVSTRNMGAFFASSKIYNAMRRFKPEVMHFHDSRAHGFGLLANRRMKIPAVISRRVAFPIGMSYFSRLKYFSPRQRYIAVSQFIKKLMIKAGIEESLIDVIYDCVDLSVPLSEMPLPKKDRQEKQFLLGSVGALEIEKGHDLLIQAMRQVRKALPESRCIIAGSGNELRRLQKLAADYRLGEYLQIIPTPHSLVDFLRRLDLFVLPSRVEGLGSILLLVMHCGVPILASNAGGIPELVEDGTTGFLFQAGDVEALGQAILTLAGNLDRRTGVIENARRKVEDHFSIEVMTETTLKSYERVIGSS